MPEPRILFFIQRYPPVFGGGGLHLKIIRESVGRRGWESTVLTGDRRIGGGGQPGVYRLPSLDTGIFPRLSMFLFLLLAVPALVALRRRYDIIHTMGKEWGVYAAILIGRLLGKPVIISSVQNRADDPSGILTERFGRIKNAVFSLAFRYSCQSLLQMESYRRAGYRPESLRFIPIGVDSARFRPAGDPGEKLALRERLGLPREGFVALSVGAIVERKGIDLLVEAWIRFRRTGDGGTLVLVGPDRSSVPGGGVDDAYVAAIRAELAGEGLADSVRFVGSASNVLDYLQAADVFVLMSRGEGGVTLAHLEALATALPFVVWDLPDYRGYDLVDGVQGFLLPPFDTALLAESLAALASSVEMRERMGREARRLAMEFTWDRNAAAYERLYREATAPRTGDEHSTVQNP